MREINYRTNCRVNISTAATRKLSEILKKGGLVVNQTVVLLMKCVQVQFFATQESGRNFFYFVAKNCVNICASNPPFLKLRQALMRWRQVLGSLLSLKNTDLKRMLFKSMKQPLAPITTVNKRNLIINHNSSIK